jgi:hypothetical protein
MKIISLSRVSKRSSSPCQREFKKCMKYIKAIRVWQIKTCKEWENKAKHIQSNKSFSWAEPKWSTAKVWSPFLH